MNINHNSSILSSYSEQWRIDSQTRRRADNEDHWTKRITKEPNRYRPDSYSEEFLKCAELLPGERVFDMGCGAGTLAIPCAEAGHPVVAADFSQGMLNQLSANIDTDYPQCRKLVTPLLLSWTDNWEKKDIFPNSFDVAFASRSLITKDLEDVIKKLSSVAKRKVCVTAVTGDSPRVFGPLLRDIGLTPDGHNDALFVMEIAKELGFHPEMRMIISSRKDTFRSKKEAFEKYREMLTLTQENLSGQALKEAEERLSFWLDNHLVPVKSNNSNSPLITPDIERIVPWAFISWSTVSNS